MFTHGHRRLAFKDIENSYISFDRQPHPRDIDNSYMSFDRQPHPRDIDNSYMSFDRHRTGISSRDCPCDAIYR